MKLELNCEADYIATFLSKTEADSLFHHLNSFQKLTQNLTVQMMNGEQLEYNFGKMMFIDKELHDTSKFEPKIWGPNEIWSIEMELLRDRIIETTGHTFETCVCIYYPDGNSGVEYHSDPPAFGDTTYIASMSLGAERRFHLREKSTRKVHDLILHHGSLLMMGEACQENYEHALPQDLECMKPRINLTFRKYGYL